MNVGSFAENMIDADLSKMGLNRKKFEKLLLKYSSGTAHLLEHSVFLTETPEQKSMIINFNAYTSGTNTNYLASFSPSNIFSVLSFKMQQISSLKYFEPNQSTEATTGSDGKIIPTIFNEVDQVNSEYLMSIENES